MWKVSHAPTMLPSALFAHSKPAIAASVAARIGIAICYATGGMWPTMTVCISRKEETTASKNDSNASAITNGVRLGAPAMQRKVNSSRGGAFATNVTAIYTRWRCAGQRRLVGRDHCTHGKNETHPSNSYTN